LKIAVIGLGYWGPQLVRNLTQIERCSGIIACDLDELRLRSIRRLYPAVTTEPSFEKVLEDDDVAGVVLATPVSTHETLASQVLGSGKSVLVEKPLATSSAGARRLVELAREQEVLVMAAHTFLYSPPVLLVRDLLQKGELGEPLYVQSSRINLGIHQSDVSVIWDLAPHDLSILMSWFGEKPIQVSAASRSTLGIGQADVAFIDLVFPSGCLANLHLSWLAPTKVRRVTLVASKKMVIYEDTNYEEPVKIFDKGVHIPDPTDYAEFKATYRSGDVWSPRVGTSEPLGAELKDFIDRVAAKDVPGSAEEGAVDVITTIEAAERSAAEGGAVIHLD
jgi:predicted dehydrogenase